MKICENEYSTPEAPKSTPEPPKTTPGGSKIDPGGSKINPGGSQDHPRRLPNRPRRLRRVPNSARKRPGNVLGCTWGAQRAPQRGPKVTKNGIFFENLIKFHKISKNFRKSQKISENIRKFRILEIVLDIKTMKNLKKCSTVEQIQRFGFFSQLHFLFSKIHKNI
jgi:hypothetical protein